MANIVQNVFSLLISSFFRYVSNETWGRVLWHWSYHNIVSHICFPFAIRYVCHVISVSTKNVAIWQIQTKRFEFVEYVYKCVLGVVQVMYAVSENAMYLKTKIHFANQSYKPSRSDNLFAWRIYKFSLPIYTAIILNLPNHYICQVKLCLCSLIHFLFDRGANQRIICLFIQPFAFWICIHY